MESVCDLGCVKIFFDTLAYFWVIYTPSLVLVGSEQSLSSPSRV